MPIPGPTLCVAVHDVAPATLADCRALIDFLDALQAGPLSLLVVPDFLGRGRADRDARFVAFIESRRRRGDEVVLHGLRHTDAEFSALDMATARSRLMRGLAILRSAGWQPRGFVAPAWSMSAGTLEAVEDLPLDYCSTRTELVVLRSGSRIPAPSLAVSTRSTGRRAASLAWNLALLQHNSHRPVLRAALHPSDLRFHSTRLLWQRLLASLLERRRVVIEGDLLGRRSGRRMAQATP
jgi:hypothetical protein